MSFDLAFWSQALEWAGRYGGLTSYGARYVRDLSDAGVPWTLVQAGDIPADVWSRAASLDPDTVLVVTSEAGGKRRDFRKVAKSAASFKRGVKPALRGDLNGGTAWAAWVDRNQKIAAATATVLGTAAAVILGAVATPAASVAMLAGTSAIVAAIEAGSPAEAIEKAAEDGTLTDIATELAAAGGVDPATVEAVASAAADVAASTEPEAVDAPVSSDPAPESTSEPSPELVKGTALEEFKADPVAYVMAHPGQAIAALGSALALGYLAFRYGIRPR